MQSSALTVNSPSSATTATVYEHACLFTRDLRRKQKRWQDGRLKYHSFNRRVMVYDERGNFVGDTHWREGYDLADGDDLELERGGVLIQVGECLERRDQDLSELIDKRAQERAQRQAAAAAVRRAPVIPITPLHADKSQPLAQRHLHDVIGTPSGHHGRAVIPRESPYVERQRAQTTSQGGDLRPAKRQKKDSSPPSKNGYAQSLFGATLTLSGWSSSQAPSRHRASKPTQEQKKNIPSSLPDAGDNHLHHSPLRDITQTSTAIQDMCSHSMGKASQYSREIHMPRKPPPQLIEASRSEPLPYAHAHNPEKSMTISVPLDEQPTMTAYRGRNINHRGPVAEDRPKDRNPPKSKATRHASQPENISTGGDRRKNQKRSKIDSGNDYSQREMSQGPKLTDINEGQTIAPLDQPRTELKIKPRKKRGLLMMSGRQNISDSSVNNETVKQTPKAYGSLLLELQTADDYTHTRETTCTNENPILTVSNESQENTLQRVTASKDHGGDDNSDGCDDSPSKSGDDLRNLLEDEEARTSRSRDQSRPRPTRTKRENALKYGGAHKAGTHGQELRSQFRSGNQVSIDDMDSSDDVTEEDGCLMMPRKKDIATGDEMPGPRLAKLGRKSIKSKEVIGLVFEDDPRPLAIAGQNPHPRKEPSLDPRFCQSISEQQHGAGNGPCERLETTRAHLNTEVVSRSKDSSMTTEPAVLSRQNSKASKPSSHEPTRMIQAAEEPVSSIKTTIRKPAPSITNPATRGRKAAKPSDAAGQVPICPLPAELSGNPPLHQNHKKGAVQRNADHESGSPLPGFSRANGGPWSREAADLFDFKRPL